VLITQTLLFPVTHFISSSPATTDTFTAAGVEYSLAAGDGMRMAFQYILSHFGEIEPTA